MACTMHEPGVLETWGSACVMRMRISRSTAIRIALSAQCHFGHVHPVADPCRLALKSKGLANTPLKLDRDSDNRVY